MNNTYKEIYSILKKIKRRFVIKNIFMNICIISSVALIIGIFLSLLSRFIPIYNVYQKICYLGTALTTLALFYSLIVSPNIKSITSKVDSFGLKERVSTVIEIEKKECLYKDLLAEDALNNLKQLDYKKNIAIIPNKNFLISFCILLFVLLGSTLLPNPLKGVAEKKHVLAIYKKEEVKKVETSVKKVEENKKLSEEQKKDLISKLQELKEELKSTKDVKEVDKALEKTTEKLVLKKNEELSKDLKNLEAKLSENKKTQKLSEAIKKGDNEVAKKELKAMDENSKKQLKETLSKASASISNSDLKEQLDSLEGSLSSGDENAINSSVDQIAKTVKKGNSSEEMNKAVAQAQKNLQGQTPQEGAGTQQAQGQGSSGQGDGSGQGQGAGQGSGQGAGGSGAGNGSGNKDSGVTAYGSGGIANKTPGKGSEKSYEKIFTPKNLGGTTEASGLTGKKGGDSGSSDSYITDKPNAELGNLKPYDQVIGEYSDKAMEGLNNNEIPDGMKDVVKGYFSSLQ